MILRTIRGNRELRFASDFNVAGQIISPLGLGQYSLSGVFVDQSVAYGLPAVSSVIRQPAGLVASMPFVIYDKGDTRTRNETAWQYDLLHNNPDPESDRFRFFYDVALSLEASQNAFIHKIKTDRGKVILLRVLDPQSMRVTRDQPIGDAPGALRYEYFNQGKVVALPADKILHIRGFTPVPGSPLGVSLIEAHKGAIGVAAAMQRFEGDYFRNNGQAPMYFTGFANQQQAQDNADLWNAQHQGPGNQWKPGFLWGANDVKSIPISNSDAQFIESKRLTVEDACRIWHWPHHLMELSGETPLRNELAWTALFIKIYVRERLTRIESAFAADPDLFLGQDVYGAFLTDELERASEDVRAVTYKNWLQAGVMTPNEARAKEGLPPLPGGDDLQFPIVGGGAVDSGGDAADAASNGQSNGAGAARSLEQLLSQ